VRHLARELRPLAIDQLGLLGSLRELAAQHSRSSLTVDVTSADLGNLSAATEVVAYAIVAEALTNVARHSQAGHCTITLRREDHCLDVTIRDDGIGTRAARNGIGLTSMDERAGEIGGTWTISSAAGNGTTVHARLPTHTEGPPTTRASAIIEAGAP